MIRDVYASAPAQKEQQQQQAQDHVQQVQDRFDTSWAQHEHSEACPCKRQAVELSRSKLNYYSITCAGSIEIPTWICHDCLTTSTPRAIPCGCFPSSPVIPDAWLGTTLLDLYGELGPAAGLSVTGTCKRSMFCACCMHVIDGLLLAIVSF